MSIRDEEIKRLIKYAGGLGLRVVFSNKCNSENEAAWTLDGTELWIYTKSGRSKTDIILSLIHELGHHLWFIHQKDRNLDLKFEEAIGRSDLQETKNIRTPKKQRYIILNREQAGTLWWDSIYKETNMKLPKWKLDLAKEFDIWIYEQFAKTGEFPNRQKRREKRKILVNKHGPK